MNKILVTARLLICASIATLAACADVPKVSDSADAVAVAPAAPCQKARSETSVGSNIIHRDCATQTAMTEEQKRELQYQLTNRVPPKVR